MSGEQQRQNTGRKNAHLTVAYSFRLRKTNMNTYKALVSTTEVVRKTQYVLVQANDAEKAKLQLEAMYGKNNFVNLHIVIKKH